MPSTAFSSRPCLFVQSRYFRPFQRVHTPVVGTRDHIVGCQNRAALERSDQLRFRNQACVVGDVPHDRRLNEVTLPIEALSTGTILPFRLASKR